MAITVFTTVDIVEPKRTAVDPTNFQPLGDAAGFFFQGDIDFQINVFEAGEAFDLSTIGYPNIKLSITRKTDPDAPALVVATGGAAGTNPNEVIFSAATDTVEMQEYLQDIIENLVNMELLDNTNTANPQVMASWTSRAINRGFDPSAAIPVYANLQHKIIVLPDRPPLPTDDNTLGYELGSMWRFFNVGDEENARMYMMQFSGTGAAVWDIIPAQGAGLGNVIAASPLTNNKLVKGDGGDEGVQTTGIDVDNNDNMTGILEATIGGIPIHKTLGHQLTSGVLNGGGDLLVNGGDNTLFDVSDGQGYIMDLSDADNPIYKLITWTNKTGIAPLFPLSMASFAFIDTNGNVQQQSGEFTLSQYRTSIPLGVVLTPDGSIVDSTIDQSHDVASSYLASDLAKFLDVINDGNVIGANGVNLKLNKTAGTTFEESINRIIDANNPNVKTDASIDTFTFDRAYGDGEGGITLEPNETDINPNQYDTGDGLDDVPNNKYTNLYVYFFSNNSLFVLQYGEIIYDNLAEAKADALLTAPSTFGVLPAAQIRAVISVQDGTTNLAGEIAAGDAFISKTGKFGFGSVGGGGVGSQDLQATYNLSTDPEILTDPIRGAFTLRRGSDTDDDNVFDVENNAGVKNFEVTGKGDLTTKGNIGIGTTSSPPAYLSIKGTLNVELTGTVTALAGFALVNGSGTLFQSEAEIGQAIIIAGEIFLIAGIASNTILTLDSSHVAGAAGVKASVDRPFISVLNGNSDALFRITPEGDTGFGTDTPLGKVHIKSGPSGATPISGANTLIVEDDGAGGISILTPSGLTSSIKWGSNGNQVGAHADWNLVAKLFNIGTGEAGASLSLRSGINQEGINIDGDQNVFINNGDLTVVNDINGRDVAADGETADAAIPRIQEINNTSTGAYELVAGDNSLFVKIDDELTIPTGLAIGFNCTVFLDNGTKQALVTAGVTVKGNDQAANISGNGIITLLIIATNTVLIAGEMES